MTKKGFAVFLGSAFCLSVFLWSLTGTAVAATINFTDFLKSLTHENQVCRYDLTTQDDPLAGFNGMQEVAYLGSPFSTGKIDFGTTNFSYSDIYRAAGGFLKEWTGNDWFVAGKEYYVVALQDGRFNNDYVDLVIALEITEAPIPPSALLLGSGIIGLIGFGLRRRSAGSQG